MATVTLTGAGGRQIDLPTGLFINNEFVLSSKSTTLDVQNPSTGSHLATVSAAGFEDIDAAVTAAKRAFNEVWKSTLPATRAKLLHRLADLIERDAEILASLEAIDAGILYTDSLNLHINQTVDVLRYFAGWADKITGKSLDIPGGIAYTRREPLGVCGAIVPWNAPLMITTWKLAPAVATGNVLIIKTPELAPLYGQKLAQLIIEAGFPPGIVQVLTGEGQIAGQALAEHPSVRKIAFTGSTLAGRSVLKAAAMTNLKKVTLELGGKGPSIVFQDADFENALFWTTLGITANNGQICAAGSRIYVHESIYPRFMQAFHKRAAQEVQGDPLLSSTTKGPVISRAQQKRILDYVAKGEVSGAKLLYGGGAIGNRGYFVENTAFVDVNDDAIVMKEEIFGPVAAIAPFKTEADVISRANNSDYGLSAAIFTSDVNRAHRVALALESGQVTINTWGMLNANTPFGGVKQSGFGRDMGEEALEGWTTVKAIKFHLLPHAEEGAKL